MRVSACDVVPGRSRGAQKEDNTEQVQQGDPQIEDLPNKETPDDAQNTENVKGGGKKRGGKDDDLDDLEVER